MTACGYTPCEIDEMTLHDVLVLFAYWRDSPPAHEILKWAYRVDPKSTSTRAKNDSDPSGIGGLIARFPDGRVRAQGSR
jgi:hypothetical protein